MLIKSSFSYTKRNDYKPLWQIDHYTNNLILSFVVLNRYRNCDWDSPQKKTSLHQLITRDQYVFSIEITNIYIYIYVCIYVLCISRMYIMFLLDKHNQTQPSCTQTVTIGNRQSPTVFELRIYWLRLRNQKQFLCAESDRVQPTWPASGIKLRNSTENKYIHIWMQ